jgi:hypothetical protein
MFASNGIRFVIMYNTVKRILRSIHFLLCRECIYFVPSRGKALAWWQLQPIKLSLGFSRAGRDHVARRLLGPHQLTGPVRILDIGAGDPYEDNNTVLFQTEGNAEITSIDIHERFISLYALKRTGRFIHAGVGPDHDRFSIQTTWSAVDQGAREFTEIDYLLGVGQSSEQHGRDSVEIKPLEKLVEPGNYDLLFLRNHGYEEMVLEGISFEKFEFRFVFIENNSAFRPKSVIREYMRSAGYELCGRILGFDDVFKKSAR